VKPQGRSNPPPAPAARQPAPAARQPAPAARQPAPSAKQPALPKETEHILIESEDSHPDPHRKGLVVRLNVALNNPLRRAVTKVTLFEDGVVQIVEHARGKRGEPFRLNLQYLDPIPSIRLAVGKRSLLVALACVGVSALAVLLTKVDALQSVAMLTAIGAAVAAAGAALVAVYRTAETTEYYTLHGRALVLSFTANVGAIKRFRALVPELSRAIEESAERISGDTSAFLRAEMREHYRLRGDGVLASDVCAESTGRILAQFDVQL
jgi:hypothetical protein